MKVYCEDCKFNPPLPSIICKVGAIRGNWFSKTAIGGGQRQEKKNEHNDCSDYKRLWWKFWVRP